MKAGGKLSTATTNEGTWAALLRDVLSRPQPEDSRPLKHRRTNAIDDIPSEQSWASLLRDVLADAALPLPDEVERPSWRRTQTTPAAHSVAPSASRQHCRLANRFGAVWLPTLELN